MARAGPESTQVRRKRKLFLSFSLSLSFLFNFFLASPLPFPFSSGLSSPFPSPTTRTKKIKKYEKIRNLGLFPRRRRPRPSLDHPPQRDPLPRLVLADAGRVFMDRVLHPLCHRLLGGARAR